MKQKLFITAVLLISALATFSQNSSSFGVNVGYDQNMFITSNLEGNVTNELPDMSIGANLIYGFGEKVRLRAELRYSNISYTQNYLKPSTDVDNVELSKITANNIGIVPHLDYKLFNLGKMDVYATAGLRYEFNLGDYVRTYTYAGDLFGTDYTPTTETHAKSMMGATLGFLFKVNVSEKAALTLSPEYTSYFWKYYDQNEMAFQRASLNFGFEWRF